ncbi:MAG: YciI family protein [Sneathiella sp.]
MTTDPIPWATKVADVRSKGVLGMQLYAIFTEPSGSMDAVLEQMGPHLAYQKKLENDGIIFGAGPFSDDTEQYWQGSGMVIIRASSLKEATKIADADPMHQSQARNYRIRPWLLNEGSFSTTITFSDGGRKIR